jgi:hypothetical protein
MTDTAQFSLRTRDVEIRLPTAALAEVYRGAIPRLMERALHEH